MGAAAEDERTSVAVAYERTALDRAAGDLVDSLAAADRQKGDEWAAQIGACLAKTRA